MNTMTRHTSHLALFIILAFISIAPAGATIIWSTGNVQYTNVNIAADIDALSIVGAIGNTGMTMTFENMIGPDGTTQVDMHGQHGVAFIESTYDSQNTPHTGFFALDLIAQVGTAWTAGDFALDLLNSSDSTVTLTGIDQFGVSFSSIFTIASNGQNQYNFLAQDGEKVTSIHIQAADKLQPLQDLKQLSLNAVPAPEPITLSLLGMGLAGLGFSRRRKQN